MRDDWGRVRGTGHILRKVLSLKYKTSSPYNAPHPLLGPGYNGWKAGNLVIIMIKNNIK